MNKEGYSRTKNSKDNWETPKYFFDLLDKGKEFNFTLDPCATKENMLCDKYYTIEDDGLKQDWGGEAVFVNPPFSHIAEWCKKCWFEGSKYNTTVVMILPSRTDTRYWHDYIMDANEIWFCKGRVNFLMGGKLPKRGGSNFPLSVVVFGNRDNYERCFTPILKTFYHKEKDLK